MLTTFTLKISIAFILGSIIGLERQFKQRNAGLRTNTLVSLGSAAFVLVSEMLTGNNGDPSRIAAQIVSGIGFIGEGLILKDGINVRGLNSAATIWCSAACGTLSGVGLFYEGLIVVILVLSVNLGFERINKFITKTNSKQQLYSIHIDCSIDIYEKARNTIMRTLSFDGSVKLDSIYYKNNSNDSITIVCEIETEGERIALMDLIISRLRTEYGILYAGWSSKYEERYS